MKRKFEGEGEKEKREKRRADGEIHKTGWSKSARQSGLSVTLD